MKEGSSDVAEQPSSNMAEHLPSAPEVKLALREEPPDDKLRAVGMIAETLTANQKRLLEGFLETKPSEEHLSTQPFCIRDIWDLGGQEVYLATHSALMPNNRKFGLYMYMVVMDISKSLSDKAESSRASNGVEGEALGWIRKNGDFPLYWLGSIAAAHEETDRGKHWLGEDEEVDPPPVFAIGSHRDVLDNKKEKFPNAEAVKKWRNMQGNLLEDLLKGSKFVKHIVLPKGSGKKRDDGNFREFVHFAQRIFLIDNSVSGSASPCQTVNKIRKRVDSMTKTYWSRRNKQPLLWVYLELLLLRWSQDPTKNVLCAIIPARFSSYN